MATLQLLPEVTGYATEEHGAAWKSIPLPGGLPRTRRDLLDPNVKVSVTWFCTAAQYEYLMAFYAANVARNYEPFFLDLILDNAAPTSYAVRIAPKSLKLTAQRGNGYWVGATLIVTVPRPAVSFPTLVVPPTPPVQDGPLPVDPLKQPDPWISSKPYPLTLEDALEVFIPTFEKLNVYEPEIDSSLAKPSLTALVVKSIVKVVDFNDADNLQPLPSLYQLAIKDTLKTYNYDDTDNLRINAPQFIGLEVKKTLITYENWPLEYFQPVKPQLISLVIS